MYADDIQPYLFTDLTIYPYKPGYVLKFNDSNTEFLIHGRKVHLENTYNQCYGSLLGNRLVNLGISKQQHLYLKTKNLI